MAALAYTPENSTSDGDKRDARAAETIHLSEAQGTFALRRAQYFKENGQYKETRRELLTGTVQQRPQTA